MKYVYAMRAVVETHKARSDCHPHEVSKTIVLAQQYHINKDLKVFDDRGREAVRKKMKQLDDLEILKPKKVDSLTNEQKKNALPCLMFISEKNDGSVNKSWDGDGSATTTDEWKRQERKEEE